MDIGNGHKLVDAAGATLTRRAPDLFRADWRMVSHGRVTMNADKPTTDAPEMELQARLGKPKTWVITLLRASERGHRLMKAATADGQLQSPANAGAHGCGLNLNFIYGKSAGQPAAR